MAKETASANRCTDIVNSAIEVFCGNWLLPGYEGSDKRSVRKFLSLTYFAFSQRNR
ncbi:hypothetical protein DFP94_1103 [Fontibacillus phaseoli]|uniref:Uncharacterized protein n=1 Tax=Fontibacillus phaseoli TaxID=1416533 RepID=A0A369B616_9BACL|nr:hypothetical protein DFP94_1103 [Fontibacillus phaseoli]